MSDLYARERGGPGSGRGGRVIHRMTATSATLGLWRSRPHREPPMFRPEITTDDCHDRETTTEEAEK